MRRGAIGKKIESYIKATLPNDNSKQLIFAVTFLSSNSMPWISILNRKQG